MPNSKLRNHDTGFEPTPSYASVAEIELAEQLRYKLEEQYFGPSAGPAPLHARLGEGH